MPLDERLIGLVQRLTSWAGPCLGAPEDQHIPIPPSEPDRSPSPSHRSYAGRRASVADYPGTDTMMTGAKYEISPGVHDDRRYLLSDRQDPSNLRLVLKARGDNTPNISPAMPPGVGHPTFASNSNVYSYRRSRPQTSHQKAVDINRRMRVEHILHQQLSDLHKDVRRQKKRRGECFGYAAMQRIYALPGEYDTDDERWGPGGLIQGLPEDDDYGEDALRLKKALDRAARRLERDANGLACSGAVRYHGKRKRKQGKVGSDDVRHQEEFKRPRKREDEPPERFMSREARPGNGARHLEGRRQGNGLKQEESLDDLDLDLLGESRDDENGEDDPEEESGLDDTEGEGEELSE